MIDAQPSRTLDPEVTVFDYDGCELTRMLPDEVRGQCEQLHRIISAVYDLDTDIAAALGLDYDALQSAYRSMQAALLTVESTCARPSCTHHPVDAGHCAHHLEF